MVVLSYFEIMANQYYNELIRSAKPGKRMRMRYDSGESAGLHTRGNVLLGVSRFLTSLKPRFVDAIAMKLLF